MECIVVAMGRRRCWGRVAERCTEAAYRSSDRPPLSSPVPGPVCAGSWNQGLKRHEAPCTMQAGFGGAEGRAQQRYRSGRLREAAQRRGKHAHADIAHRQHGLDGLHGLCGLHVLHGPHRLHGLRGPHGLSGVHGLNGYTDCMVWMDCIGRTGCIGCTGCMAALTA
eukprot:363513-Chlamydomonas_euryale.AAC.3